MEDAYVMEANVMGRSPLEDEASEAPTPVIGSRRLSTQRRSTGGEQSLKIIKTLSEQLKKKDKSVGGNDEDCNDQDLTKNDLLLSVFDGHGGSLVSEYASKQLLKELLLTKPFLNSAQKEEGNSPGANGESNGSGASTDPAAADPANTNSEGTNSDFASISEALHTAYLTLDSNLYSSVANEPSPPRQKMYDNMGCTAISAYISDEGIHIACLGDSRAVLCRNYEAISLSKDHKPGNAIETARILNAGGTVQRGRINGNLAVSRSFGDFFYKNDKERRQEEQMVSPVPDITITKANWEEDQFLILACDGVWDVVTEQDACYLISEMLGEGKSVEAVCKKFLDYCMLANSRDNMSIILCVFPAGWDCKTGAFMKAPKLEEAMKVKDNLGTINSHVEKQKANTVNKAASASRRASMQVFEGLKDDDGIIKIATRAAMHSDELLRLNKEVILSWDEHKVVENMLKLCELDVYGEHFIEEGVDGKLLMELTQDEMEDDLLMNSLDARFLKMATTFLNRVFSG
eukprot:CAMPEP_0118667938 /NCGR_PEP_ID=MMETSP0785-20121206/20066_1 /TAXON_ID=91992 /ORGANISM="Bolidomonas pacifica, Strain CCMP 1866" /LENGTH=517 /DNA_ID=CAMNT_0006562451 /DNA_START=316 /DNA_END=1869 /DNA_ORIENTATION=+